MTAIDDRAREIGEAKLGAPLTEEYDLGGGRTERAYYYALLRYIPGAGLATERWPYQLEDEPLGPTAKLILRDVGSTLSACRTSFSVHVPRIIRARTEEKVIGADTRGIITMVEHQQAWPNHSIVKFPGYTVSEKRPLPSIRCHDAHLPVALEIRGSGPNPARIRLLHMTPETRFHRTRGWLRWIRMRFDVFGIAGTLPSLVMQPAPAASKKGKRTVGDATLTLYHGPKPPWCHSPGSSQLRGGTCIHMTNYNKVGAW